MNDFVELSFKRNRGWPWPEDSYGATPMYGADGWCHSCGVPKRPQTGSIVLQRKGMKVDGAWVPNWQFDVICVDSSIAAEVQSGFDVDLRLVEWHPSSPDRVAYQIVVPSVGNAWFDPDELRDKTFAQHGTTGATCPECDVWRWMPMMFGILPPLHISPALADVDIAASPEWFGDGLKAFRQILVRRELADLLARASPRDFKVQEIDS